MAADACDEPDALVGKLEVVYQKALEDHNFAAAATIAALGLRTKYWRNRSGRDVNFDMTLVPRIVDKL